MALTDNLRASFSKVADLVMRSCPGASQLEELQEACATIDAELRVLMQRFAQLRTLNRSEFPVFPPLVREEVAYLGRLLRSFYPDRRRIFMRAADVLRDGGHLGAALDILARLLHSRPDLEDVHAWLEPRGGFDLETSGRASLLSQSRRLLPRGSFGHGLMGYPIAACGDEDSGRLFISDHGSGDIHCFNLADKSHRSIRGGWGSLMGICLDAGKNIWMCDIESFALVTIDQEGTELSRISIPELLGEDEACVRPEFISIRDRMAYVLTSDRNRDNITVFSFLCDDPKNTVRRYPALGFLGPAGVHAMEDGIYYASVQPPAVLQAAVDHGVTRPWIIKNTVYLYQFVPGRNGFYLTHPEGLISLDRGGNTLFDCNLSELLGEGVNVQGVAAMRAGGKDMLYLADFIGKRVLAFET